MNFDFGFVKKFVHVIPPSLFTEEKRVSVAKVSEIIGTFNWGVLDLKCCQNSSLENDPIASCIVQPKVFFMVLVGRKHRKGLIFS